MFVCGDSSLKNINIFFILFFSPDKVSGWLGNHYVAKDGLEHEQSCRSLLNDDGITGTSCHGFLLWSSYYHNPCHLLRVSQVTEMTRVKHPCVHPKG